MSAKEITELRDKHFCRSLTTSYEEAIEMSSAKGQYMYDSDGRQYLDAYNNVAHVGHCNQHVVAAVSTQLATLNTNTRYLYPLLVNYAQRLTATLPESLQVCFFVNSGSEANDLALRLAQRTTLGSECIVLDHAYHGTTLACVHLSPTKAAHAFIDNVGGPTNVHKVSVPDTYRGEFRDVTTAGVLYAEEVQHVLQTTREKNLKTCAFFAESIQGCGGQIVLPPGYLKAAYEHVRAAGGLCVADEVQVGFGRTGSHFWAFEAQGVVPDIVSMGKPMGNGIPLAAVVTTKKIADAFADIEYFNTFGGSPIACAAGMAVLDVIERDHLQQNAKAVGQHIMDGLEELAERFTCIGDVRGAGLYIGVEFVHNRETQEPAPSIARRVVNELKETHRILTGYDGPHQNVLRMKGPMCITMDDGTMIVTAIQDILENIDREA